VFGTDWCSLFAGSSSSSPAAVLPLETGPGDMMEARERSSSSAEVKMQLAEMIESDT